MTQTTRSISRSALVLWLYGTVAALLTVGIYLYTKDTIAEQRRMAEARALKQIIADDQYDNELLDDKLTLLNPSKIGQNGKGQAYIARRKNKAVAVILPVLVTDGYGGDMKLIVGIKQSGEITGVRVLSHNETPGLGDKVDARKSNWILSFSGRSLTNPPIKLWRVKKDGGEFDQFTGATITPRAVVKGVLKALTYFEEYRENLLSPSVPVKSGEVKDMIKTERPMVSGLVNEGMGNGN
ncbi:MAG: electron transport complex subunit RsxG [Pseudomonadales bacterium]|nr:electron transport complex subunit RsxG [Pseudomonadales bacterium]